MNRTEFNCETQESATINLACYKDAGGKLIILDEGQASDGLTPISDHEAIALSNPPPPAPPN